MVGMVQPKLFVSVAKIHNTTTDKSIQILKNTAHNTQHTTRNTQHHHHHHQQQQQQQQQSFVTTLVHHSLNNFAEFADVSWPIRVGPTWSDHVRPLSLRIRDLQSPFHSIGISATFSGSVRRTTRRAGWHLHNSVEHITLPEKVRLDP